MAEAEPELDGPESDRNRDREFWLAAQVLLDAARAQAEADKRRSRRELLAIVLLAAIYVVLVEIAVSVRP